jgi:hypothetical protein
MFWALNGATRTPRRLKMRHKAVATTLLPTSEPVPNTAIQGARRRLFECVAAIN